MEHPPLAPTLEELLAYRSWVRTLAGKLVRDPSEADDVVQEAWRRVLTRPPLLRIDLRAWFASVVRSVAASRSRSNAARESRELNVARSEAGESLDDVVARAELERVLAGHVLALEEPFRTAILLRFREGLEPRQVAARTGVPLETARSRIRRGLERLREELDARGGRQTWLGAVAALAIPQPLTPGAITGVVLMTWTKLAAVAAVTALLGLAWYGWRSEAGAVSREAAPLVVAKPLESSSTEFDGRELAQVEREPLETVLEPTSPKRMEVVWRGHCVDPQGFPLQGATVRGSPLDETTTGADGQFELRSFVRLRSDDDENRRGILRVVLEGHASVRRVVQTTPGVHELGAIVLEPAGTIAGRVLDASGNPVVGARVAVVHSAPLPSGVHTQRDLVLAEARTDPAGTFVLEDIAAGTQVLEASAEGFQASSGRAVEVRAAVRLRVPDIVLGSEAALPRFEVHVVDPNGDPVPQARITYRARMRGGMTSADKSGVFLLSAEESDSLALTAVDRAGRWRSAGVSELLPSLEPTVLQLGQRLDLDVSVRSTDGAHVPAYRVWTTTALRPGRIDAIESSGGPTTTLTVPGETFRVVVDAPGYELLELGPFAPERPPTTLEAILQPLPGWSGVAHGPHGPVANARVTLHASMADVRLYAGPFPARSTANAIETSMTDDEGRFRFTGRVSGLYYLRARSGNRTAELGPVELRSNVAQNDLEIELAEPGAIEGQVLLGEGHEPHGVIVGASRGDGFPLTARPDSEGRFRFEELLPGPWLVEQVSFDILPGEAMAFVEPGKSRGEMASSCFVQAGRVTGYDLDLRSVERATVQGRLLLDGRPMVGWSVRISGSYFGAGKHPLDAEGRFTIVDCRPGPAEELLFQFDDASNSVTLRREVELRQGMNDFELNVPTGGLEGLVASATPDALLGLRLEGLVEQGVPFEAFLRTNEELRYAMHSLPAGRAQVSAYRDGTRIDLGEVVIVAGRTVQFDLP